MMKQIEHVTVCCDIAFVAEGISPEDEMPEGYEMTQKTQAICMCCKNHPDIQSRVVMSDECRNVIGDAIREIIECADEAKSEWDDDRNDKVAYGRLFALCEVLTAFKINFYGIEEVEKLLDFDIDGRYICS